jgi:Tol biopolymer transport system component
MSLSSGTRIGAYEIIGSIGAGGMGEVFRARDTKLNRDVAIKVLPAAFADDPERLARFTREAQTLASLNHPNIATIYGIEEVPAAEGSTAGSRALVMELIEGEDLSVHLSRGPIPLAEALPIARQIAEALEAAHEQGIVHRDLKPANIKVRADGTVKVLDFGLAKAMDPSGASSPNVSHSPTLTHQGTMAGMIIGTAAYMSPEQAKGKTVDKRADIWAFGVVLYEMLTGRRAFKGEDVSETLASVLKDTLPMDVLPTATPPRLRRLIERCLERDLKNRLRDIGEARVKITRIESSASDTEATSGVVDRPVAAASAMARLLPWAVAGIAMIAAFAMGMAWFRAAVPAPVAMFVIPPQENLTITAGSRAGASVPVISPDGRTVAFTARDTSGKQLLWLRPIDSLTAFPLAGTDNAAYPFWSPDSRFLAYAITGKLMRVGVTGGPPQKVCDLTPGIISRGGSWNRDGILIFNNGPAPLYRAPASGGDATMMGKLLGRGGRQFPAFLPDGRHFLYHTEAGTEKGVYVGSLDDENMATRVLAAETGAVYDARSGRVLFVRSGTLLAQAFDLTTFTVSGDTAIVAEHVESAVVPGLVAFSVSNTGVLAYGIGESAESGFQLTWVDRTGKSLGTVGPEGSYRGVDLSPNGRQVAVHRHDGAGGDIWLIDLARGAPARFTFGDAKQENATPVWSPDGRRVAYSSTRDGKPGIYVKAANNSGAEERLFEQTGPGFLMALDWSPDERFILFGQTGPKPGDIWQLPVPGNRPALPLLQSSFNEGHGQYSPDGRWVAYTSNESGTSEVLVQSTSPGGGKWVLSNGGGNAPRWRGDSREVFYIGNGKMWAVSLATTGRDLVPALPTALFDQSGIDNNAGHGSYFSYDVARDGQRFLMSRRTVGGESAPGRATIIVVLNWMDGIKP